MTSDTDAAAGGSERIDVAVHKASGDGPLTPRAAANSVTDWRRKNKTSFRTSTTERRQDQRREGPRLDAGSALAPAHESPFASAANSAATATEWSAEPLATRDAALQSEETGAPGGTERADPDGDPRLDAGSEPPIIEPPRSWTKEERERFYSLPRETQEYIANREQERDREIRRSQNEAAEARKTTTAERDRLEQARLYYESSLPTLLQSLQTAHGLDFSDLKSMAEIRQLAVTNPPRYAQWDAQQRQIAAVQNELAVTQQLRASENAQRVMAFAQREGERLVEKVPEMADDGERTQMRTATASLLAELGFDSEEVKELVRGDRALSFHDHRVQMLLRDAIRLRDAQEGPRDVHARPVPLVQKPGAALPRGAARDAHIQNLSKQLDNAHGMEALRLAAKLTAERRRDAS
jgi:hypothetical protein